jgi:hypothetical protein
VTAVRPSVRVKNLGRANARTERDAACEDRVRLQPGRSVGVAARVRHGGATVRTVSDITSPQGALFAGPEPARSSTRCPRPTI